MGKFNMTRRTFTKMAAASAAALGVAGIGGEALAETLSLIHISEPTRH